MADINNVDEVKRIDKRSLYSSLELFPNQIEQAWDEVNEIIFNDDFKDVSNIVISGMGGSALGGRIIDSLISERLRVPIILSTDQSLPAFVNRNTLVMLSSYSGNTEETLESAKQAVSKHAKIIGITTGGKLKELLDSEHLPLYEFLPLANPSGQPRMGLGYSVAAILGILSKLNFIHLTGQEMKDAINIVRKLVKEYSRDVSDNNNLSKRIALMLKRKIPVLISSEHLFGVTHAFKNQLNENAKTFSLIFDIPEANHHLMEGLRNPAEIKELLHFIFFESDSYSEFVKKRYLITKEVVEKNEISVSTYKTFSKSKIEQIFEVLTLGIFVSYYEAIIYGIDPMPIPWVDYFKEKIK